MTADPRDGLAAFPRRKERSGAATPLIAVAFAALAALALYVTFGLNPPPAVPVGAPTPVAPPPASATPAEDPNKAEAERLISEALRRVARLEGEGVRHWGDETVQAVSPASAQAALERATALHDRQQHGEALPLLRQAIADFDTLVQTKPERLRLALSKGQQALDDRDAPAALAQFERAAALAPSDAQAAGGLARARVLPQVLDRFKQGESAEAAGNLAAAREHYQALLTLDPAFEAAREPLRRVDAAIAGSAYRAAISEALARLNEGDIRAAEAALERARRLEPRAPEIEDLRQRIRAASQLASLDRLRAQAAAAEGQEKWADAVRLYEQALAVDRNAAFAANGRERAQHLAQLHAAIDAYIAQPARLQSAEPLAHARTLVAQAVPEGEGKLLASKKAQLSQLIAVAQMPIPVTLRSDGSTHVTLQRVGSLGTFDTRRIELPPGRYVAVGSRAGYRDTRVPFDVAPGAGDPSVLIQCTEPIR